MIRREIQPKGEGKKPYTKAPKIQRLVTPQRLQHKRHRIALKRRQAEKVKDEAVCGPRLPLRYIELPLTSRHRMSTPRSWPSALPRPSPSRPISASVVPAPCASRHLAFGRKWIPVCIFPEKAYGVAQVPVHRWSVNGIKTLGQNTQNGRTMKTMNKPMCFDCDASQPACARERLGFRNHAL